MTEQPPTGLIRQVSTLDLSHVTAEDLAAITGISKVAMVLVPESLAGQIWKIPMDQVGAVIPVPDGARVEAHTGAIKLGGDALAEPGDNAVLVVTGALMFTSPVSKVGYRQIIVTGSILAPTGSESALGAALSKVTGSVEYFRYVEGQSIDMQSGQISVSGEYLANPRGTADDILAIGGQLLVTGPIPSVGYQRIYVGGTIVTPRASRAVLEPALHLAGSSVWYGGDNPRVFHSAQTFSNDFFELLDDPITMVLTSDVEFEPDVSPAVLRRTVTEIASLGAITASRSLIPTIQLLAVEHHGELQVAPTGETSDSESVG